MHVVLDSTVDATDGVVKAGTAKNLREEKVRKREDRGQAGERT